MTTHAPRRRFRRPVSTSPPPRHTGSVLQTDKSSSTGPTVTTSAPLHSSAGPRRRRCTWSGCSWRPAEPAGKPDDDCQPDEIWWTAQTSDTLTLETDRLVLRPIATDDNPVQKAPIRDIISGSYSMYADEGIGLFGVR